MTYTDYLANDAQVEERLKEALLKTYFSDKPADYFSSDLGAKGLRDHVSLRYNACLLHIVPWVAQRLALADCHVVEIGCGTGSATAAFDDDAIP